MCKRGIVRWPREQQGRDQLLRRGLLLFFFFQAEDGIRDLTVTGVQTCALPILCATPVLQSVQFRMLDPSSQDRRRACSSLDGRSLESSVERRGFPILRPLVSRSEERRVGKECRSRWSPYH